MNCRVYIRVGVGEDGSEDIMEFAHEQSPGSMPVETASQQLGVVRLLIDQLLRSGAPFMFHYVSRTDDGTFCGVFPIVIGPRILEDIQVWAQPSEEGDDTDSPPVKAPDPVTPESKPTPTRPPNPKIPVPVVPSGDPADWWKGNGRMN